MAKTAVEWDMGFDPEFAGWTPPELRTKQQHIEHDVFLRDTPLISEVFTGSSTDAEVPPWKVCELAIAEGLVPPELVRKNTLKNIHQQIGSCVGWAAGNMALWRSVVDAKIRKQQEAIKLSFVPYHYGRGRLHSGIRGSGSGSMGSGQAKALVTDGHLPWDHPGVPKPTFGEAIKWTSSEETKWSNGANIAKEYVEAGQKHQFETPARVTSTDELATLLHSYYVCTCASNWGGQMRCSVVEGVLLNKRAGVWNHQMWVLWTMVHPTLGRLFYIGNNWSYVHGVCPTGAPEGGFWVTDKEMAYIIRQNEVFAFADAEGFVDRSRAFDWSMF